MQRLSLPVIRLMQIMKKCEIIILIKTHLRRLTSLKKIAAATLCLSHATIKLDSFILFDSFCDHNTFDGCFCMIVPGQVGDTCAKYLENFTHVSDIQSGINLRSCITMQEMFSLGHVKLSWEAVKLCREC